MVQGVADLDACGVVFAHFESDGRLPHAGNHVPDVHRRREHAGREGELGNARRAMRTEAQRPVPPDDQTQTRKSRCGQDGGVEVRAVGEFLDPGRDVAPYENRLDVGSERLDLRCPPRAAGRDRRGFGQAPDGEVRLEAPGLRLAGRPVLGAPGVVSGCDGPGIAVEQDVTRIGPFQHGPEGELGGKFRGKILQAMNGDGSLSGEEGVLDFLREKPLGQRLVRIGQRCGLQFVARGLDDLQLEHAARKSIAAELQDGVRLRQGKGGSTGGDEEYLGFQTWNGVTLRPSWERGGIRNRDVGRSTRPSCR